MDKYSINVAWSDEDDCFVAKVPEFPGLSAFGDTKAEAMSEAEIALSGFLKVYDEDGCPLPEPHKVKEFSGQIRIRIPKSLHEELSRLARQEGVSLNTIIVSLLSERQRYKRIKNKLDSIENLAIGALFAPTQQVQSSTETVLIRNQLFTEDWVCETQ